MMMALRALLVEFEAMLPRSLLGRSIMIIVTPVVLLQVISAWVFYDSHWNTVTKRLAQSVAGPPLLEYRSGSAPVIRLYDFAPPDADGSGRRPIVVSGTLDQVRSRPPAPVPALVFAP